MSAERVFVVWEPVLATDDEAPESNALGRLPLARQYWDPQRLVSAAAQPPILGDRSNFTGKARLIEEETVWDYIALYPPGMRWEREFPRPERSGAPVADVLDRVMPRLIR